MPLEFRDQRLDQATEQGELVSRAMSRMCCYQCGSSDGMQAFDEAITRTMPAREQQGYYRYPGDRVPGTIYRPCPVCQRSDEAVIDTWYTRWTP